MSLLADAFQPLIPSDIWAAEGKPERLLPADSLILGRDGFEVKSLGSTEFQLDYRGSEPLTRALCSDVMRFSNAVYQSLQDVREDKCNKPSLPWDLIRLYYASFYAAHCLFRLSGKLCTYLGGLHVDRISDTFFAASGQTAPELKTGLFHISSQGQLGEIFGRRVGGQFGGSHRDFWNLFAAELSAIAKDILASPMTSTDSQAVFAKLDELITAMRLNRSYDRLTLIRNEIQYRHGHGTWLPSALKRSYRDELVHIVCQWQADPMSIRIAPGRLADVGEFASICTFIVSACRAVVERLRERSPAGRKSFVNFGYAR